MRSTPSCDAICSARQRRAAEALATAWASSAARLASAASEKDAIGLAVYFACYAGLGDLEDQAILAHGGGGGASAAMHELRRRLDAAEADAVAGAKAAAEKEAGLHKAIAALTRIEDAERQLRAARAARRAKAKEKAADSLCATRS